ncbi:MAG: DUF4160 domain-containing protein [Pseudomonadota bacterium]
MSSCCFLAPRFTEFLSGQCEAKFWLKPTPRVAESDGFDSRTLRELLQVVEQNAELIERSWNEHFR